MLIVRNLSAILGKVAGIPVPTKASTWPLSNEKYATTGTTIAITKYTFIRRDILESVDAVSIIIYSAITEILSKVKCQWSLGCEFTMRNAYFG